MLYAVARHTRNVLAETNHPGSDEDMPEELPDAISSGGLRSCDTRT
jgi:hypothetical protein